MNDFSIEVYNLRKVFGEFVAVDNVSFSVKRGEIFGFLGANGAGKSTTIRMLCALLEPTSGTALVGGFDIKKNPEGVKRNIGYMSQKFSLYEDLTVTENLDFYGGVYGLSGKKLTIRKNWALEMAGLKGNEKSLTGKLSGGWKQRLALGCSILHEPKIVFLDEPTGGVDPISRRNFWDLINSLSDAGVTIFVTTHFLDEAEYCNTIYLMQDGKVIAGDSPRNLKKEYLKGDMLEIECSNPVKALEILSTYKPIKGLSIFGTYLHAYVESADKDKPGITEFLNRNDVQITRIDLITPSLEDVFIHLIEKK
jgi:ABC-2 type transport system ATP-binding protein